MLKMGPVVSFRGCRPEDQIWDLSVIVVADHDPGPMTWSDGSGIRDKASPVPLWVVDQHTAWRYSLPAKSTSAATTLLYRIDDMDQDARVSIPATGTSPRLTYASCNGFSDPDAMKSVQKNNALWEVMADQHAVAPFNILLLGGDQVYADEMLQSTSVPSMKAWAELDWEDGNKHRFTSAMKAELERFYFNLYVSRWSQPQVARMMASVPMIAMWDDHDILDGWGSYPVERQTCRVYRGLFPIARQAFSVFQQQLAPGEAHPCAIPGASAFGFSAGFVVGPLAIAAIDMRSERSLAQVLSRDHWEAIYSWIDTVRQRDTKHLLVMSSIPVVYPGFDILSGLLGAMPGYWDLEDDFHDHWNGHLHQDERRRLIHRLLALEADALRVTVISGDVHVAAHGVIESSRGSAAATKGAINQLISSAIVHPGPGAIVAFALRHLLEQEDEIDRGIVCRMLNIPGTRTRFMPQRNFMTLDVDPTHRIWAKWFVEEGSARTSTYTKVIHPT